MLPSENQNPPFTAPLFVWLAIQLLALGLSAARLKLWAGAGPVAERFALDEMLAAQFASSSLLFPFLCRNFRTTCATILSAWPMIALAGYFAAVPAARCAACGLNLTIWLFALAVWTNLAKRAKAELIAIAIFATLNLSGSMLIYFVAETGGDPTRWTNFIPLPAAIRIAHFSPPATAFFASFSLLVLSLLTSLKIRHRGD